jgi:hypothetical protein
MRDFAIPGGLDYSERRTTPPLTTADAVKDADSQFGVEHNQVGKTVPDLAAKAQVDLVNKVSVQRNG